MSAQLQHLDFTDAPTLTARVWDELCNAEESLTRTELAARLDRTRVEIHQPATYLDDRGLVTTGHDLNDPRAQTLTANAEYVDREVQR